MSVLTHWGRVTHICVGNLTIIGSDNGLSPSWRQAIIWTNAGILLIGSLATNFNKILIEVHAFSFKEMHLKMSSGKWPPSCLGLSVLTHWRLDKGSTSWRWHFQMHFLDVDILIQNGNEIVPIDLIDYNSLLVQVMAWHQHTYHCGGKLCTI